MGLLPIAPAQEIGGSVSPRIAAAQSVRQARSPAGYSLSANTAPLYKLDNLPAEKSPLRPRVGPRQMGIRREIPRNTLPTGSEQTGPGGRRVWRIALHSPEAAGIRVHFAGFFLPPSASVWIYPAASGERANARIAGPYTSTGLQPDGQFWSALIRSDTVLIEYDGPAGAEIADPPFRIDAIAHFWKLPAAVTVTNGAASCELDVSCYSSYASAATASVTYDFIGSDGGVYDCSGAMINDKNSDFTPYLLTAHHCIGSSADAASVEAYFFYQTSTCNGPPPDINTVPVVMGASYLAGADIEHGDYALLRLDHDAPGGVTFLGWNANDPSFGSSLASIQHPEGSWTRIAFGIRIADANFFVDNDEGPASLYYQIEWRQGITEPGSSGSPLLNSSNQIVGTLTAGPAPPLSTSICFVNPFVSAYGRLSAAYPALAPFLNNEPLPSIFVNPSSLSFNVVNGSASGPASQTVRVTTGSVATVSFVAEPADPWVSVAPASGTVSAAAPASLSVTVQPSALPAGQYSSSIRISANGIVPITIPLTANVTSNGTASLSLESIPGSIVENPGTKNCPWLQHLVLRENSGIAASLTYFAAGTLDLSSRLAEFFGSTQIHGGEALQADICWTNVTAPSQFNVEVRGADQSGHLSSATAVASFASAPPSNITLGAAPGAVFLDSGTITANEVVTLSAPSTQWTASLLFEQPPSGWVTAAPLAGAGTGAITLTAHMDGLAPGLYRASLILQAQDAAPQYRVIPVSLSVGGSAVSGATFLPGVAPGGILSFFGSGMASGTQLASAVPLPTTMQGTRATVNGVAAPLFYVSPNQINLQVPFGTAPGNATLLIASGTGRTFTQSFYVDPVAPAIFLAPGSHIVPPASVAAGRYATLFLTGQGPISPAVADGNAPPPPSQVPPSQLPKPLGPVTVYLDGQPVEINFGGIPYYLVGVTQVNFQVPTGTPPGDHAVVVFVGNTPSHAAYVTVK